MCSYRTVYRFIKQILFFSYFLSLNTYSSPIFILCQCCQQICNLVTYFLGVCIGGGIVGMDIWSRIFVEELRTIFKVCVCLDKRRWGQPNVHRCGQGGGGWGGRRGVKGVLVGVGVQPVNRDISYFSLILLKHNVDEKNLLKIDVKIDVNQGLQEI